jgi:hypothetical protein
MVQLPALNTPQFGLVRTDFASHPQPVPPTFHPEVAAEAIVGAADPSAPGVLARMGDRTGDPRQPVIPRLLDSYLARTGDAAQLAD